jgi:hypothetical protein
MTDDTAISYDAAAAGTPVLSSSAARIGTLEHVLEVPELDLFDGIVVATQAGARLSGAANRLLSGAAVCCSRCNSRPAQEREMRAAFVSTQQGSVTYAEDMTLNANAEFGDPGACRRR